MDMTNSAQCSLYFLILMKLDEAYFFKKKEEEKKKGCGIGAFVLYPRFRPASDLIGHLYCTFVTWFYVNEV